MKGGWQESVKLYWGGGRGGTPILDGGRELLHGWPSLLTFSDSMMETFDGHWAGSNGYHLFSELRRHRNSIHNRLLLKTSFHCLLSFTFVIHLINWLLIHWSLSPTASSVSWCWSCFVISDLHMKYTEVVVPLHKYIMWFVIVW